MIIKVFVITRLFGITLFVYGTTISIGWQVVSAFMGGSGSTIQLPLSPQITVTSSTSGDLYVGDEFYGRIQRYTVDGRFRDSWSVEANGGKFVFKTNDDGTLEVAPSRVNVILTYSSGGRLLGRRPANGAYIALSQMAVIAPKYVTTGLWFPRVIDTHNGKVMIEVTPIKWIISAPLPSFAFAALGLALAFGSQLFLKRFKRAL